MRIYFLPAVALGVISFVVFRWLYLKTTSKLIRALLILAAAALSTPAVWFTSNYALSIPYADWFFEFHAIPGIEATSGLVGSMLGVMFASSRLRPGKLNKPIVALCTIVSTALLVAPFAKQMCFGLDYSALHDEWKDGICVQTSGYSCVPSCATTLIRMQGGHATEQEMAMAAGTTSHGTEAWYLTRALRARGYDTKYQSFDSLKNAPVPSIVGVVLTGVPHVVVLLHRDKDGVVIGEPMSGRKKYSWKVFKNCYQPTGSCITIHRVKQSS